MILIDMRMPNNCVECPLADKYQPTQCPIYAIDKGDYWDKRFEKCPLKGEDNE